MKKRLEAELISIAHRILKLKNKSEVDQLYKETQKLYETLSVLKFYQDNYEAVKSEVSENDLENKLTQPSAAAPEVQEKEAEAIAPAETAAKPEAEVSEVPQAEADTVAVEEEPQQEIEEDVTEEPAAEEAAEAETQAAAAQEEEATENEEAEPKLEEIVEEAPKNVIQPESLEEVTAALTEEEIVAEVKPAFEPNFQLESEEEEKTVKLEDFLGDYKDPVFVKPNEVSLFGSEKEEQKEARKEEPKAEPAPASINENQSKSIAIGLNDRIGFVNHLFNGSSEDFNRVLSQLNTFNTFEEAKAFINEMVIPDYNYWVGEEEYIERFMAIVEKKFQ